MVNNFLRKKTVFETNYEVDQNVIEDFFSYSSPTEKLPLGRKNALDGLHL